MIGKHLVDRFDNHVCTCRTACRGTSFRSEIIGAWLLYALYAAGRTAHDIVWANYSIHLLVAHISALRYKNLGKLEDLNAYAMQ
jgi:hypothetical protein